MDLGESTRVKPFVHSTHVEGRSSLNVKNGPFYLGVRATPDTSRDSNPLSKDSPP